MKRQLLKQQVSFLILECVGTLPPLVLNFTQLSFVEGEELHMSSYIHCRSGTASLLRIYLVEVK